MVKLGKVASVGQMWNGQIACLLVHKDNLVLQQGIEGASVFAFAMVKRGSLTVDYNGVEMELTPNDIHTYAPGMPTTMLHVTDDYEGYCLIIDEALVRNTPLMSHLIKAAYQPIAEFGKPEFSLTDDQASLVWSVLTLLREHIMRKMDYQREALLDICEVFCIDLIDIQNVMVAHRQVNTHRDDIFTDFLQLVSLNFMAHHDLRFYADHLNISTPYLSRIVREMSGRTVMSFIDHALAAEAARRLKTTSQSVTAMSFDFGFSDQAAFTKFFTRMKGVSPKTFRKS
jgi:AraC-like DNA-binding protein